MDLDLSKIKKVFFVGIGGIGISAIARMLHLEGKEVSGSDMSEGELTGELRGLGIKIVIGQGVELIPKDADLIIYTIAIPHYDPKLFAEIKELGIPFKSYPEMLGLVTRDKYTIAISGTHGKTTTTAMLGKILIDAGLDPTIIVGSLLKDFKSNLVVGKSKYFVVEACEYERSFLNLHPKLLVITNIEADHLDYYKDLNDINSAFDQFRSQSEKVIENYSQYLVKVPELSVPGEHNRQNAAAALTVAEVLGIGEESARKSLAGFSGTWRRLEKKGTTREGVIVYDDYAHHPTEIRASIQALRELYPDKRLTIIFQPHLYSRTKALFGDFVKSFRGADRVILLPIYFAREEKDESVSSDKLAQAINLTSDPSPERRGEIHSFPDFEAALAYIKALNLGPDDVFVAMGAGEADKLIPLAFSL